MKIGDKVVIINTHGEFETKIKGVILEFYEEDRVIVRTKGHDWLVPKETVRVYKDREHSTWSM